MARGMLWQGNNKDPLAMLEAGIAHYVARRLRYPACVRVRAETLAGATVAEVHGVPVVVDERVQPGCVLCCEGVEP